MMPSIFLLLNILAILAPSIAAPFDPSNPDTQTTKNSAGQYTIDFAADTPTCANDASFVTAKGKDLDTGAPVSKSDCDAAIANICQAAIRKAYPKDHADVDLSVGVYSRVGTCEGHILFNWKTAPMSFTEEACVSAFAKVANKCVAQDAAVVGRQAGVMNAWWSGSKLESPYWWANTFNRADAPGYLLGPVVSPLGYYGWLGDVDAASVP